MNILSYLASRSYRDKFSEEYSKELIDRFEFPEREYEKIYSKSKDSEMTGSK